METRELLCFCRDLIFLFIYFWMLSLGLNLGTVWSMVAVMAFETERRWASLSLG